MIKKPELKCLKFSEGLYSSSPFLLSILFVYNLQIYNIHLEYHLIVGSIIIGLVMSGVSISSKLKQKKLLLSFEKCTPHTTASPINNFFYYINLKQIVFKFSLNYNIKNRDTTGSEHTQTTTDNLSYTSLAQNNTANSKSVAKEKICTEHIQSVQTNKKSTSEDYDNMFFQIILKNLPSFKDILREIEKEYPKNSPYIGTKIDIANFPDGIKKRSSSTGEFEKSISLDTLEGYYSSFTYRLTYLSKNMKKKFNFLKFKKK